MRKTRLIALICCLTNITLLYAQDNKPTKEETIAFLNHYYQLNQSWNCVNDAHHSIKVNKITLLDTCKIKIEWRFDYYYSFEGQAINNYQDYVTVLDMNKVEELSFSGSQYGNCTLDYLSFTASPSNGFLESIKKEYYGKFEEESGYKMEVSIPVGMSYGDGVTEEEIKVLKAFDHLRKLCGAPDPISFD